MYFSKTTFFIFCLTFGNFYANAQIHLSEIVSKNENSLEIDDESPDWIEIGNTSNLTVDLSGYYLSDDADNPTKWAFPTCEILPQSYLLVLANDQDEKTDYLQCNFKISSSGETILLSKPSINFIEQIAVPPLDNDISFAKIGEIWTTATPSPEMDNNGFGIRRLEMPIFSDISGVYQSEVNLEITHENPSIELIYFKDDLTTPIKTGLGETILNLKESTIICAQATKQGLPSSELRCESFIVNAGHDLPVLSLIANQSKLFDEEIGIFELGPDADENWPFWGANFWKDDDTEVYFQYFNTTDSTFYGHADLEAHGGRESRTNPQKTFRLKAKNKYNQPFFDHPFFSAKRDIIRYKRLVVRNASGDFNAGHCRDGFLQDYLVRAGLDLDANGYQPIVVYINGQYYGVMGLREKMDEFYTLSNYQTTDIDLLENDRLLVVGDSSSFNEHYGFLLTEDLSEPAKYEIAQRYFDINNLTDYFIAQIGNVSTAWPQNNIKYWRPKAAQRKWRYLLFDMDIALGRHNWTLPSENALLNKMTSFGDKNVFINIVNAFLKNNDFRNYFFNRHQDLFNTVLGTTTMLNAFDTFITEIEREMPAHFDRWPSNNFSNWENKEQEKIRNFINERAFYSTQHFNDFFELGGIYNLELTANYPDLVTFELNSLKDIPTGFRGSYFKTIPISLAAKRIDNLYFNHWELEQDGQLSKRYENPIQAKFDKDSSLKAIYSEEIPFLSASIISTSNNMINLNVISPSDQTIQFELIDVLGRKLNEDFYSTVEIGSNVIDLPISNLSEGIIFLNLKQGAEIFTLKLLR